MKNSPQMRFPHELLNFLRSLMLSSLRICSPKKIKRRMKKNKIWICTIYFEVIWINNILWSLLDTSRWRWFPWSWSTTLSLMFFISSIIILNTCRSVLRLFESFMFAICSVLSLDQRCSFRHLLPIKILKEKYIPLSCYLLYLYFFLNVYPNRSFRKQVWKNLSHTCCQSQAPLKSPFFIRYFYMNIVSKSTLS